MLITKLKTGTVVLLASCTIASLTTLAPHGAPGRAKARSRPGLTAASGARTASSRRTAS